jgi:hypothetical protein
VTLLRLIKWKRLPYSVFACIIILGYQWALGYLPLGGYEGVARYIVLKERTDWFSQNREGIFSFLGMIYDFLTNVRLSLDISSRTRCGKSHTPGKTTFIPIHSIFAHLNFCVANTLLNNIHRTVSLNNRILRTHRKPSFCTLLY